LAQAAMELYVTQGYDATTVAEIAHRAGLTERTFFRHFADKREVLFGGAGALEEIVVYAVASAPPSASLIDAVAAALEATGQVFDDREFARRRQTVIVANAELRERELIKLASLAAALADALCARGVDHSAAALASEAGIAVLRVAFERWIDDSETRDLPTIIRSSLADLKAITRA
jgi:AcrR family transcriptional regulator